VKNSGNEAAGGNRGKYRAPGMLNDDKRQRGVLAWKIFADGPGDRWVPVKLM